MVSTMSNSQVWFTYLQRNIDLCFISGLSFVEPPGFMGQPPSVRALWHGYQILTDFFVYFATITNFVGTVMLDELFPVLASIPPLVHGIQLSGRILVIRRNRKYIKRFMKDLNETLAANRSNPIEKISFRTLHKKDFDYIGHYTVAECFVLIFSNLTFFVPQLLNSVFYPEVIRPSQLHKKDFDYIGHYTVAECFVLIFSNLTFFVPQLLNSVFYPEDARVIMSMWYPYNTTVSPNKEITNISHTILWMSINFKIATCDTLFLGLVILLTSQLKHLKYLLGRLFEQEEASDKLETFDETQNRDFERKLKWWIRQHQNTLRNMEQLKKIYSPALFFSYFECMVNMCLCAFLATEESPWTPIQRFSAVFIVGVVFVQLFFMSRAGDNLQVMSTKVTEDAFTTASFRSSRELRQHSMMVLQRGNKDLRISAFGLFELTSEHYGTLVRGVFSYYMALRQFQDRKSK